MVTMVEPPTDGTKDNDTEIHMTIKEDLLGETKSQVSHWKEKSKTYDIKIRDLQGKPRK